MNKERIMKCLSSVVLLLLGLMLLHGCQKPQPSDNSKPEEAAEWVSVSTDDGRAEFMVPVEGKWTIHKIGMGPDSTVPMHHYEAGDFVTISYYDFAEEGYTEMNSDEILGGAQEGAIENTNGVLVGSKDLTVDGHPAKEFSFTIAEGEDELINRMMIVQVGGRLYMLQVMQPKDPDDATIARRFFDSLKLKPAENQATQPADSTSSDAA